MSEYLPPISSVTTREHHLVKEHFDEVEKFTGDKHAKAFTGHTFSAIVEPKELGKVHNRHFPSSTSPERFGLVVVKRELVGFPPQSGPPFTTSGELAVQAGSFLEFADGLDEKRFPELGGFGPQRIEFVSQIAGLVRLQMREA